MRIDFIPDNIAVPSRRKTTVTAVADDGFADITL